MACIIISTLAVLLGSAINAADIDQYGQEVPMHQHGAPDEDDQDGIPNWYDPNCCNKSDCKPVEAGALDFTVVPDPINSGKTVPGVISKRDGFVYTREQIRRSQDSRYHECMRLQTVRGRETSHYCVYIPWGF